MKKKLLHISALLLAGTITAQAQNLSGRILFSIQNASYDSDSICTLQPDGSNQQYITNGSNPRLSPNGEYMAFLYGSNSSRNTNHIYFRNASGAQYEYYNNGSQQHTYNYDFTPTSYRLIFDWEGGIYDQVAAQAGGGNSLMGSGAGDFNDRIPRLRPTDSMIVFGNSAYGLYLLSGTGSAVGGHIPNTGAGDVNPYWSPDGQWIYFGKAHNNADYKIRNLYRIKPDGSQATQITSLPLTDTIGIGIVITKNGKYAVAPAKINGVTGLYKFKLDGVIPQVTGTLIKAFPHVKSVSNLWLGNADVVTDVTAVNEVKKQLATIYPNPAKNEINIKLAQNGNVRISCINAIGQIVKEARLQQSQTLSIANLPSGHYILDIKEEKGNGVQQLKFTKD